MKKPKIVVVVHRVLPTGDGSEEIGTIEHLSKRDAADVPEARMKITYPDGCVGRARSWSEAINQVEAVFIELNRREFPR